MAKNKRQAGTGDQEQELALENSAGEDTAVEQERESADSKNIVGVVWDFLSSMKLGIVLLLVLAIVSIIGTIWIPKDPFTGQQDFTVFYNNVFFRLLLGLLALNLLVCSLNRWKSITSTFKGPNVDVSDKFVKSLKSTSSLKTKGNPEDIGIKIKELLGKKGYRVFVKEDGEMYKIASDKGHLGIIGPYISHISFMIMIVAVVIKFSGLVGFEGTLTGIPGETYNLGQVQGIQNVDFEEYFDVKINDFRTEYRPDGSVKQWYTDATIIDGDNKVDYSIWVNNPMVYKGIKFYQMSYGYYFNGKVSGPQAKEQPFEVALQDYIQPQGTDITFIPMNFNDQTKKVFVRTYKGNQLVKEEEVAPNTPYKFEQAELVFSKAGGYTVLSVKRDPGVPIIGAGSLLLMFGVTISFILRQRRIWTIVSPEKDGAVVQIGGISAKDKRGLDNDLDDIITELKN